MEGKYVYLFHILGVAPLLLYIALKKPDWSESALVVLAVTALALHLRLLTAETAATAETAETAQTASEQKS